MGRLRSLEKMTPKKAIFSTVLSKIVAYVLKLMTHIKYFDQHFYEACFQTRKVD